MLKAPKFTNWKVVLLPLDEEWGIARYDATVSSNINGVYWYVIHSCGSLACGQSAPSKKCWCCDVPIPPSVLGYWELCNNKNIGS